jgi:hypothetical protein
LPKGHDLCEEQEAQARFQTAIARNSGDVEITEADKRRLAGINIDDDFSDDDAAFLMAMVVKRMTQQMIEADPDLKRRCAIARRFRNAKLALEDSPSDYDSTADK